MKFEERRVSIPERRLLLQSAERGAPESALVVPELPVESIEYLRAVVLGDDFVEHALARLDVGEDETFALCEKLLTLRGPWSVSASPLDGVAPRARLAGRDELGAAALVAVAVRTSREDEPKDPLRIEADRGIYVVHLAPEGRGWLARVEAP